MLQYVVMEKLNHPILVGYPALLSNRLISTNCSLRHVDPGISETQDGPSLNAIGTALENKGADIPK